MPCNVARDRTHLSPLTEAEKQHEAACRLVAIVGLVQGIKAEKLPLDDALDAIVSLARSAEGFLTP